MLSDRLWGIFSAPVIAVVTAEITTAHSGNKFGQRGHRLRYSTILDCLWPLFSGMACSCILPLVDGLLNRVQGLARGSVGDGRRLLVHMRIGNWLGERKSVDLEIVRQRTSGTGNPNPAKLFISLLTQMLHFKLILHKCN
ncbi:hypothetical protein EI94DRAFT_313955 [Lactarius quietus]|nr:hypothetical protein EI94DRAFT_313955 [Lactarius quietus]